MQIKLLLATVSTIAITSAAIKFSALETGKSATYDLSSIPVCGMPASQQVELSAEGRYITALPGWGSHSYAVATESDSAQYFFDQGLSLYYGYHFKEALASFKESARFDPDNAMAYWGQALTMGPYYNGAHNYTKPAEVQEVLSIMNRKAVKSPGNEVKLIGAMNRRYSDDPADKDRPKLNEDYANAMRSLAEMDDEAKILYVDAVMLIHPWDFWATDGSAKSWTSELISFTNDVLKNNPRHPAALHYHIHLTEASRKPEVALESAQILKDLMPGVAHMVHMASHEYERNGLYADGVKVNTLADSNLRVYNQIAGHLALNTYSAHYFAVQTYCALTGGMYQDALRFAHQTRASAIPTAGNNYDQYLFMLPILTKVRMGKWDEILSDTTKIAKDWIYASLLSDFASGMASVYQNDLENGTKKLASLREHLKNPVLKVRRIPFNSSEQTGFIAEKILEGALLYAQKKPKEALSRFEQAVALEDQLIYTEPKDWPVPARQFLGAYLLREKNNRRAREVYEADLAKNPANGWSLVGLSKSISSTTTADLEDRIRKAFSHADHVPAESVFME